MGTFALMAGGTGGHLFPAMALAQEMQRRGHAVHLMTDNRVVQFGDGFPAREIHIIPSATPSIRNPVKFVRAGFTILSGIRTARGILKRIAPDAAVAFGGYPCFPSFMASAMMGVPGVLHEQNAVLGRANRALARFANALALSFPETVHADKFRLPRLVTGNPVRDLVHLSADTPYPGFDGALQILVFGGSQGARVFADQVPPAIALLDESLRRRVHIVQQCRPEDMDRVAEAYRSARVNVELAPFFGDLPTRIAQSHLVIGRAGASTVAELAVLGRPAILVPLPGSLDQDQRANATMMETVGGGWLVDQATLSPQSLATQLHDLLSDPARLTAAAQAAKGVGHVDAVERLADLVENTAKGKK